MSNCKLSLQCILCLGIALCFAGIASADNDTQSMDRPGFKFSYPASWRLADTQPDFNADQYFTIDSEGRSTITIELFNFNQGQDPDDLLFNAIYVLDGPLVNTMSRSHFEKWGRLEGEGTHLKGKVMGLFPGGARIFFAKHGQRGVMITEIYYAEDLPDGVADGFELIGTTFEFK